MMKKTTVLATFIALTLSGCSAHQVTKAEPTPVAGAEQKSPVEKRELSEGVYEMAISQQNGALYVATAQSFKDVQGGVVYKLDPVSLKTTGQAHTDLKNFGAVMDPTGKTLYVTNSLDGGISAINVEDGKVLKRLMFSERNDKGLPFGAREIILHDGLLYIGAVADPAVIWVVDAKTMTLKKRIANAGKWVTGLLYSAQTQRIYAANGGGEILVINPKTNRIEKRWKPFGEKEALLLNLAEDPATGRLFVTDNSKAKTTLVLNIQTGDVLKNLETGDTLAVKFNAMRNEIYLTQRESGKLLILDGTSYAVKKSLDLPPHPNSLLLSADGQTLYVTVKQGFNKDHSTKGPDSIVRVPLAQL